MLWAENKALEFFEKPESLRAKAPKSYLNAKKINYHAPLDLTGAKDSDRVLLTFIFIDIYNIYICSIRGMRNPIL